MIVRFHGVRGSVPRANKEFMAYGGNTACVSCLIDPNTLVIFDAGTGIVNLGNDIHHKVAPYDQVTVCHIIISHQHLDHIQGFPFFVPLWKDNLKIILHQVKPHEEKDALEHTLNHKLMCRPLFPVSLKERTADLEFKLHNPKSTVEVSCGFFLSFCPLNHPGGSWGLKLNSSQGSVCYLSDHENSPDFNNDEIFSFCKSVSLVILDTMFSNEDYHDHKGWGHSSHNFAKQVMLKAKPDQIALFHHSPDYKDQDLDRFHKDFDCSDAIFFAKENSEVNI